MDANCQSAFFPFSWTLHGADSINYTFQVVPNETENTCPTFEAEQEAGRRGNDREQ